MNLLGSDFKLDQNRDLVLENGDLTLISGIDCLYANLFDRLITAIGGLLHHPEFGSHISDLLGSAPSPDLLNRIKIEAEQTILSDPRDKEIISCTVEADNYGTIVIAANLKTIINQVTGNLIFPLASL